jgi:cephalosporin hydroxylase
MTESYFSKRSPLDQDIAKKYLKFLLDRDAADSAEQRQLFCKQFGIHPKLLLYNPHINQISALTSADSNLERLRSMTLGEYMDYHFYFIHQGYKYGIAESQQRWLGHPIVKSPNDCWIYQEIISEVKPDFVIELGVLFGGGSRFFASILDLVGHGQLIGVDVTLDGAKGLKHPRIELFEGSSVDPVLFEKIKRKVQGKKVVVIADSDHEKSHVLKELELYAPLVSVGSYLVAEDSMNDVMEYHPVPNEGPQAAAREFLRSHPEFEPDRRWAERYILSLSPLGYLKRIR